MHRGTVRPFSRDHRHTLSVQLLLQQSLLVVHDPPSCVHEAECGLAKAELAESVSTIGVTYTALRPTPARNARRELRSVPTSMGISLCGMWSFSIMVTSSR